jgi:hypothetical protein
MPRRSSCASTAVTWHTFLAQCFGRGGQELLKVPELRCNPFAARIVELFSEDGSGELDFQKTINLFSVFSPRATPETKVVWAFAVWDFDGTSCLSRLTMVSPVYWDRADLRVDWRRHVKHMGEYCLLAVLPRSTARALHALPSLSAGEQQVHLSVAWKTSLLIVGAGDHLTSLERSVGAGGTC